mmetsp:Transcript_32493/g.72260  ORF Transcript_32493/g.72260 Transcript_32493/m.72260 type:complete len:275 (+) Transcript_32493:72-896(+)
MVDGAAVFDESTRGAWPEPGPELNFGLFTERTIREVLALSQRLSQQPEEADLLKLLDEVEGYPMNAHVLQVTGIGKEVTKLKKHRSTKVAEIANELAAEWRSEFQQRNKVVETFSSKGGLTKRRARELEVCLFNLACPLALLEGKYYRQYQRDFKRLCTHLRTRGEGNLAERLTQGSITARDAVRLPNSELLSDAQRHSASELKDRALREATLGQQELGVATDEYVCPSCGGTQCTHKELVTSYHTDGQDMTILVACSTCNHRWRALDDHGLAG